MAKKENILNSAPGYDYTEKAPKIDAKEFQKVIDSRRSVRIFEEGEIPDEIMKRTLENALLAPNSSNLQPWEFYRVKSPEMKKSLAYACLNQIAAKTASELIVVVARTSTWKKHADEMISIFNKNKDSIPQSAFNYYGKIVPFAYKVGPLGIFGFFKRILYFLIGLRKPMIRELVSKADIKLWAAKTCALSAENIMLSLRAYGYDSCPMEGYDSKRINKLLKLPGDAFVVMVIAAGKRGKGGIYGKQIRFDSRRFIKEI